MLTDELVAVGTDELERLEILKRYRKLLRTANPYFKKNDSKLVRKAFDVAMNAHRFDRRKTGEPYIYHPIAVAQICVEEIGLGTTAIICALLHDTVEDTELTLEDVQRDFGVKVATIIDGLTKVSDEFDTGSSAQAENFRKMLLTLNDDVRVILIKLADRLHNMRTLDSMPKEKQLKIASETSFIFAPLAHRLGLHAIKSELEDLQLKYVNREAYYDIRDKLHATKAARDRFIGRFLEPIISELNGLGLKYHVKGRPKSIHSIWKKMNVQKRPFEEIFDLFAVRIILEVEPDQEKAACWQVYSMVTDYYQPNPERLKDWIATPRSNGYESLHTTVMSTEGTWVEVQIRSKRMDEIAEKGYAAHFKYKDNDTRTNSGLDKWINQVRDMLETTGDKTAALEFLDDFRSNLFNDEVFIFTPKGELKVMRRGATALDFAFDIHSMVGARTTAARVNKTLVPISYVLKSGDQVEILTSSKQKPHEDWLKIVVTSKAKTKIKDLIKEDNKQYVTDGKNLVEKKLKQLRIENSHETINQLRAYFNAKTPADMFYRFGKGYIDANEIKKFQAEKEAKLNRQLKLNTDEIQEGKAIQKELQKMHGGRKDGDSLLIGEDMDRIDYTLAKCCNPISGDEVFGFVTVLEGIKIHRTTCPNATELLAKYGNRVIKARWTSHQQIAFLAGLKISGIDRVGIVNTVTAVISNELHINMRSITVDTDDGIFEGTIKVYVHDTRHLEDLTQKLLAVAGVHEVTRFD